MSTSTSQVLAHAIIRLDPVGLRAKRFAVLTTTTLPLIGMAVTVYLLATGNFTATDLWLFAGMYFVHGVGVTVGYHRYAAHRAFRSGPVFEAIIMIAGAMGAQGPLVWWVATHRRHHRFSDREGDPHSPNLRGRGLKQRLRGLWYAHMPWMLSDEDSRWSVFAPDLLRNQRLMYYHRTYPYWVISGLAIPGLIGFAVEGTEKAILTGALFGGLARIFLANQATWMVSSVSHAVGSRPFHNGDRSANNWPVAFLTFGEGLQNNHHAFPGSYRHGVTWLEPDLSGWLLAVLGKLGIVTDLREPTREEIEKKRRQAADAATSESAVWTS
ncbi:acyl-CoA desaturase [Streptosporangium nondiastaticum]|uniref:Acyl-CoA desaturase n=1 Tax=Streptosporangium nondiastaticum TaxID=35764 RepID=A0A9X7JSY0_9ACTN|nr:acyl-CoA desaturase [Streptosporangium nondiastaticum]PSJ29136.1 acyl-CoA desaturase [Streptosporangium nondiastaticum]